MVYDSGRNESSGCFDFSKEVGGSCKNISLGLLKEVEYTKVKNKIMQEHNVVTFEQM